MFKIISNNQLKSALLLGAAASAAIASAAHAQLLDSPETVVVTGSRIPQLSVSTSSPLQTLNANDVKLQGAPSVETLLRDLPSVYNDGDNSATNNASNGIATIDLHDLTPIRTLVLVDGKRLVAADYLGNIDLNTIPANMVDRVEILSGGASSTYGGDAVAGVVNIILKKNFEGMAIDSSVSTPAHSDGTISTVGFMTGFSAPNDAGNVTIYGDYQRREPTYQGDRQRSMFSLNSPAYVGDCGAAVEAAHFGFCPGGSSGIPAGRISAGAGAGNMFTTAGTLVKYDGSLYNFAPINYLQTPNTHWDMGANAHYEVSPLLDFYTRLTFADNFSSSQLAEVPTNQLFTTNYGNPLMTAQERAILFPAGAGPYTPASTASFNLRRRLVENGARHTNEDHEAFQLVGGAKGDIDPNWSYDISAQYGRTLWTHIDTGDANGTRFGQALLATGTAANPTCIDPSNGCVPVDIFHGAGGITPAQASFFTVQLLGTGVTEQTDVQASVTGKLGEYGIQSPFATAPVSISVGAEWRRESSRFQSDSCLGTLGCSVGFGQTPSIKGAYHTAEWFSEVQVPVVMDKPFFKLLEFDAGMRYSDYNLSGPVTAFKFASKWDVVDDFSARASFNRAVREPGIAELFRPATFSAPAGIDPCAGGAAGYTPSKALCLATGVLNNGDYLNGNGKGSLDCGGQCASYLQGNTALKPEIGDTKSAGLIFTPGFLPGLSATIDYYDIAITQAIYALPFPTIAANCYNPAINTAQSPSAPGCALIHRDSLGLLYSQTGYVNQADANIGNQKTRGVDGQIGYGGDMDMFGLSDAGTWRTALTGTYLLHSGFTSVKGQAETVCTGQFGPTCGAPAAKWRHTWRMTWVDPTSNISVSGDWRMIGGVHFDQVVQGNIVDPLEDHIPDYHYFDISGTWTLMPGLQLRGGINNLLGKQPPIIDGSNAGSPNVDSGNTFPGTYDAIGRTYFAGINIKY